MKQQSLGWRAPAIARHGFLGLALAAVNSTAWAAGYNFVDLGLQVANGGLNSWAYGINNNGQVVGQAIFPTLPNESFEAVVWNNPINIAEHATALAVGGGGDDTPYAINNNGWVVGQSQTAAGFAEAVAWKQTAPNTWGPIIALLPAVNVNTVTIARGINDNNVIVGSETVSGATTTTTGLEWANTGAAPAALPPMAGDANSSAVGINLAGDVVGTSTPGTGAVAWAALVPAALGVPAAANLAFAPVAINKAGHVAGDAGGGADVWKPPYNALTEIALPFGTGVTALNNSAQAVGTGAGGAFYVWNSLPVPVQDGLAKYLPAAYTAAGWSISAVTGINDQGWIVGTIVNSGTYHAFLLQATSPPPTDGPMPPWALGALGVGLMGIATRRMSARKGVA